MRLHLSSGHVSKTQKLNDKKMTLTLGLSELLATVNQICHNEGQLISSVGEELTQLEQRRAEISHLWFGRVIARKDDWNQSRGAMKQTLTGLFSL